MNNTKLINLLIALNTKSFKLQATTVRELALLLQFKYGVTEEEADTLVAAFSVKSDQLIANGKDFAAKRDYAKRKKNPGARFFKKGSKFETTCNCCGEVMPIGTAYISEGAKKWTVDCGIRIHGAVITDNFHYKTWLKGDGKIGYHHEP